MSNESVGLREYLETRIADLKELVLTMLHERDRVYAEREGRTNERFRGVDIQNGLLLDANKEAINKAEVATEKRFDAVNEFRAMVTDAQSKYITKSEAFALIVVVSTIVGGIVTVANFVIQHFK